jgi:hypothetical protein
MKQPNIHKAPVIKHLRRPNFSTKYRPGNVQTTLTDPRMICVVYELLIPVADLSSQHPPERNNFSQSTYKYGSTVVEKVICTGELLKHLYRNTEE